MYFNSRIELMILYEQGKCFETQLKGFPLN